MEIGKTFFQKGFCSLSVTDKHKFFNRRGVQVMAGEGTRIFLEIDGMLTEMLTVELASYHYNYAKTTIRQWCDEDKLIFYKISGILLIQKSSMESFLKRDIATQNVAE